MTLLNHGFTFSRLNYCGPRSIARHCPGESGSEVDCECDRGGTDHGLPAFHPRRIRPIEVSELIVATAAEVALIKTSLYLFHLLKFLSDSRVMTSIVFNSVPMEDIGQTWGANPAHDRVRAVIREIKRCSSAEKNNNIEDKTF